MYWTRKQHVDAIERSLSQLLGKHGNLKRLHQLIGGSPMLRCAIKAADREFDALEPGKREAAAQKLSIELLHLSVRACNALTSRNILTIEALCQCSAAELMKIKNFGRKTLREIERFLAERGLSLRVETPASLVAN